MATSSSSESRPAPIVVLPMDTHSSTVFFVHGLGQRNEDWVHVVRRLANQLPQVKWILPQARRSRVTCSRGRVRPSWFDLESLPPCNHYDEAGMASSVAYLEDLILAEVREGVVTESRIFLIGFSQGASLSLVTALTTLHELGGVASLSGWIPRPCRQTMKQIEPNLPVFWSHGSADTEVPLSYGEEAITFLTGTLQIATERVVFKAYEGLEHSTNDAVVDDLARWLVDILR